MLAPQAVSHRPPTSSYLTSTHFTAHLQVVGDWIRERNNEKNGVKEAWMAKANAVALAVRLSQRR